MVNFSDIQKYPQSNCILQQYWLKSYLKKIDFICTVLLVDTYLSDWLICCCYFTSLPNYFNITRRYLP